MSKKNDNKKINFLEEKPFEKYFLIALSDIAIIFSILIFLGKFDISLKGTELTGNNKIIFAIILIIIGIVSFFISFTQILKDSKYKNTVFKELLNDYNNNSIKKNLYDEELDLEQLSIEVYKTNIGFEYKVEKGSFFLYVDKKNVIYSFEYNEEIYQDLTDEEAEELPLWEVGGIYSTLDYTKDKIYKEYIKFIKEYKED